MGSIVITRLSGMFVPNPTISVDLPLLQGGWWLRVEANLMGGGRGGGGWGGFGARGGGGGMYTQLTMQA